MTILQNPSTEGVLIAEKQERAFSLIPGPRFFVGLLLLTAALGTILMQGLSSNQKAINAAKKQAKEKIDEQNTKFDKWAKDMYDETQREIEHEASKCHKAIEDNATQSEYNNGTLTQSIDNIKIELIQQEQDITTQKTTHNTAIADARDVAKKTLDTLDDDQPQNKQRALNYYQGKIITLEQDIKVNKANVIRLNNNRAIHLNTIKKIKQDLHGAPDEFQDYTLTDTPNHN